MTAARETNRVRTGLALLLTLPFIFPFLFILSTALKSQNDYFLHPASLFPNSLTMSNFDQAWSEASLGRGLLNSILAVGIGVVLCSALSLSAAFWFHRHRGRWGRSLFMLVMSIWLVPWVIWLIPLFVLLSDVHLLSNLVVLGVVYAAINLPFGIYLTWSYYEKGLPPEVMEAAEVDGASLWQQFHGIVVPLSVPVLATVAALSFVFMWSDLFIAVVLLNDPGKFTEIPDAATLATKLVPSVQETAAAAVISVLPQLVVFMAAQRAMVRGFTAGAVK